MRIVSITLGAAAAAAAATLGWGAPTLRAAGPGDTDRAFSALPLVSQPLSLSAPADASSPQEPADCDHPLYLQDQESIYAPPEPPKEEEGVNAGGVNFRLTVNYMTDYVYRGIDFSEVGGSEDAPNLQFDAKLSFNLGKLPHPFIGVFANIYNDDPISRFQEIRPTAGFDWTLKPLTFSAGWIYYVHPEREHMDTSEAFASISLDDAFLFHTPQPILSPYVYGAYDYDKYDGFYIEGGFRHDFVFEDWGLVLTGVADVGYVSQQSFFTFKNGTSSGFQHYDVGLIGTYSLNTLVNIPRRYGQWSLKGYLYYTDGIDHNLRADTQLWGGAGIQFEY